jgi:hypothetical protein
MTHKWTIAFPLTVRHNAEPASGARTVTIELEVPARSSDAAIAHIETLLQRLIDSHIDPWNREIVK